MIRIRKRAMNQVQPDVAAPAASAASSTSADHPFPKGSEVEAKHGTDDDEKWFMGSIYDIHSDGTVDVLYDDGDFDERKPLHRVRWPIPWKADKRAEVEPAGGDDGRLPWKLATITAKTDEYRHINRYTFTVKYDEAT